MGGLAGMTKRRWCAFVDQRYSRNPQRGLLLRVDWCTMVVVRPWILVSARMTDEGGCANVCVYPNLDGVRQHKLSAITLAGALPPVPPPGSCSLYRPGYPTSSIEFRVVRERDSWAIIFDNSTLCCKLESGKLEVAKNSGGYSGDSVCNVYSCSHRAI